jgi:tryptophan 2,3-dioxygenase
MPTFEPDISEQITKLQEKSAAIGQPLPDFLQGVLHTRKENYWDYLNLESLLSLQRPKTDFPDELIFVTYHQVCELYFKLILWEMAQISNMQESNAGFFVEKIQRIVRYYENLVFSFDIMLKGLDQVQFSKFRVSLFPASGFQSVQYRFMEFGCTDLYNLVSEDERPQLQPDEKLSRLFKKLYWQKANINAKTKKKDLSGEMFQQKYEACLFQKAKELQHININRIFLKYFSEGPDSDIIGTHLKKLDVLANIKWRLAHFKVAARHLQKKGMEKGTGGTNWKKYLPPHYQKIVFFPGLWTSEEKENWGLHFAMQAMTPDTTEPQPDHRTLDII